MPVLERIVRPKRNRVSFEVPKEYSQRICQGIVYTGEEEQQPESALSDIVGKLRWKGDAVKEQRALREEW